MFDWALNIPLHLGLSRAMRQTLTDSTQPYSYMYSVTFSRKLFLAKRQPLISNK